MQPNLITQLSSLPTGTPQPVSQSSAPQVPSATQGTSLDPQIVNLAKALRETESGGNFQAKGASGEYGAYQFLPTTWSATAPKYGVNVSLDKATPAEQNEVAYKQLAEWKQEHPDWNVGNFASAWNAGPGKPDAYQQNNVGTNSQGVQYDTPAYAKKVAEAYQQLKSQQPQTQSQTQGSTTPTPLQTGIPGQPSNIPAKGSTASLANVGANLKALPGAVAGAANAFLPILGDIGGDFQGTNKKTVLQQGGDAVQSLLSAAMLIPGAQPEDLALKAGLEGLTARLGANAAAGGLIGASNAVGQGKSASQVGVQGLLGAGLGGLAGGAGALLKAVTPAEKLQSAIEDATPSYSPKIIGEQPIKEGGILSKRKVIPNSSNIDAGTELSKVPNYPVKGTALEKYQAIEPEIAKKGQALDQSLKNENVLRPPQELKSLVQKAVTKVAQNSVLLQKADPAVTNYLRVSGRAIDQNEGTLYGERQVVKDLDNAYEDAGGKYSNNKPLDQIHRAARTALINDMEAKATNTGVKASLKEMSNLYNAQDTLKDKAMKEGGSKLEQAMKNHPIVSKVAKTGLGLTGLGQVLHFIP